MTEHKNAAALLATLGAEKLARIIVDMALPAGTETEWDSETIEHVLSPLARPFTELGIPWVGDTGSNDENLRYWKVQAQLAGDPSWRLIDVFIDLGIRNTETGYIDSIALIKDTIIGTLDRAFQDQAHQAQVLERKYALDVIEIWDSGPDLDTMQDLAVEWEELAEEAGLVAYADGEAGVYRVTNLPLED